VTTAARCETHPGSGEWIPGPPAAAALIERLARLIVEVMGAEKNVALAVAREAATAVGPLLAQRDALVRGIDRERALVEASERRLARLAFDIHDGPTQTALALGLDVALLRAQLEELLPPGNARTIAVGRMHDLGARLAALQEELRELSNSLEPATIARKPLRDALAEQVETFARETDIETALTVSGDFAAVTLSQRIALVRIVQEALANVRQHSGARSVSVSVEMRGEHLHAEVTDDGRGFDVERTLVEAARNGRLGLVGMGERVRLLGGRFEVESRTNGPTTISVVFPPWRPATPIPESALELRATPDLVATRA
jgi:signal transduction histidine kinase